MQVREAYKDYMRQVATLLLRDANITIDSTETRRRIEQFVSDVYGQEEQIALVS
jgi:stalled ribosome rescue protein Dom34